jgi:hypothetical protein
MMAEECRANCGEVKCGRGIPLGFREETLFQDLICAPADVDQTTALRLT